MDLINRKEAIEFFKGDVYVVNELKNIPSANVLKTIRSEMEKIRRDEPDCSDLQFNDGLDEALQLIDKYIEEGDDE